MGSFFCFLAFLNKMGGKFSEGNILRELFVIIDIYQVMFKIKQIYGNILKCILKICILLYIKKMKDNKTMRIISI